MKDNMDMSGTGSVNAMKATFPEKATAVPNSIQKDASITKDPGGANTVDSYNAVDINKSGA